MVKTVKTVKNGQKTVNKRWENRGKRWGGGLVSGGPVVWWSGEEPVVCCRLSPAPCLLVWSLNVAVAGTTPVVAAALGIGSSGIWCLMPVIFSASCSLSAAWY
jgi:hypothetical protein